MSNIGFWTGATGMKAFQSKLDVVAHNIANVNTTGYKTRRASFDDLLRSRINTNVDGNHLVGHGVKQEYVDNIMGQSALNETGYELDFALNGEGFFGIDVGGGQREYTRNGAFNLSVEGNGAALVTNDGHYVLDRNGQHIVLPFENGSLNTEGLAERLGVWGFENQYGLESQNNARYTVSENSGDPILLGQGGANARTYEVRQFYLEFSSVDLSREMVEVIQAQRAFQMNSRVVQTNDQINEELNNLR
ncbi:flagellar hook-basal body protein [Ruminococcaceae bacterium OttesenSCG-928-I18]|nr:flagellar hook-basal body protein [Ruminococcaceae bacterium OttesenSCG-928-I18]